MNLRAALAALLLAGLWGGALGAPAVPVQMLPSFAQALSRAAPLTFGVYCLDDEAQLPADSPLQGQVAAKVGAGFVIDGSGLAVTAGHVGVGCTRVAVKLADERVLLADVLGTDRPSDIALLRLPLASNARPGGAKPQFARKQPLRAGDWVIAVGEPYGLGGSVAVGVVGGVDRHFADEPEMLYIQSDLALNPGNSGGPLLDIDGVIVGMNARTIVSGAGSPGVSLSIPIDVVLQIARDLENGAIVRPRLGAEFHDLTPAEALAYGRAYTHGALIDQVRAASVAQRAGLCVGDIVVGFNGRLIAHSADLARALIGWRHAAGTRFTVVRRGDYIELTID